MAKFSEEIAKQFASEPFRSVLEAWREAHPRATLREIELAVDEQLARLRAEIVSDLAQRSPLRDIAALAVDERPRCEHCQTSLVPRGRRRRTLKGPGDQRVSLDRSYAVCPRCELGLFPPR
jgi:hypothetical protein